MKDRHHRKLKEWLEGAKFKGREPKEKKQKIKNRVKRAGSIRDVLIVSYVFFAVVPLVAVNLFSSHQSKMTLKDTSSELALEMVKQITNNVSYYTDAVENSVMRIIVNDLNASGNNLLTEYSVASRQQFSASDKLALHNATQNIASQLSYSVSLDDNIKDMVLVFEDGSQVGSKMTVPDGLIEAYKEVNGNQNNTQWYCIEEGGVNVLYVVRRVTNMRSGSGVGNLVVKANAEILKNKIQDIQLFEGSRISLIDEAGQLVFSNIEEPMNEEIEVHDELIDGVMTDEIGGQLVTYARSNNGWMIVTEIPQRMLTARIQRVVYIVWGIIVAIAFAAILIGNIISKNIVKSVQHLKDLMKRAEQGDLTVAATIKGNNEISELAISFNHMIENIKVLLEEAQNTVEHSLSASNTLQLSSQASIESIGQLASSIAHIAEGSNNQAEEIQSSVMVMEKLSSHIKEVTGEVHTLVGHNESTRTMIELANRNMEELNHTVHSTAQISQRINDSMSELNTLTKAISDVMRLLDDISERTNLLALNASIEAARAGAAGNGFAVVANEVRNLATQSKESSTRVKDALRDIETKITHTSGLVHESTVFFKEQQSAVDKTYHSLTEMMEGMKDMNGKLGNISECVDSMGGYNQSMNERIQSISMVTQENAAAVEEVNALSEEQHSVMEEFANLATQLSSTIDGLRQSVTLFIVEHSEHSNEDQSA